MSSLAVFSWRAILWIMLNSRLFPPQKGKKDKLLLSVIYLKLFSGKGVTMMNKEDSILEKFKA